MGGRKEGWKGGAPRMGGRKEGWKGGRVDGGRREPVLYSINGQWKTPKSTNRTVKIIGRHRGMH